VIAETALPTKAEGSIFSTDAGIENEAGDEQRPNAASPIRLSLEPSSQVTEESELHAAKQKSQITSTEDGMQIDASD
jgi:hypothetical protein